ncbi:hypothetical protein BDM02DRAFT_1379388 [Thelephora ganbajun]|uniref:Uncharacterized protein n=1 Tax=Thelephora ganbajun TaxID=370292 RepID=A0ACB6ZLD7_THEGA|nr:hypothetical protein BDM02DRAFT_1379388 [Thelephora ganbajun]
MGAQRLPNEIWVYIFELATAEYLPNGELPNSMDRSAWFKNVFDAWCLQSPDELVMNAQKKRYKIVKAILSTCKRWHHIAGEFLFNHIAVFRPTLMHPLCNVLGNEPHLGTYAKNIYLGGPTIPEVESLAILVSIIRHCPNVDTMIISWPLTSTFSAAIADALLSFTSKKIRTLCWNMSSSAQPKVIWALNALRRSLTSLRLEFEAPTGENSPLGSAGNLNLSLPRLQTLSLRGSFQDFLEQCTDWSLPALQHVTLDFALNPHDLPDVDEFCKQHGINLTFLDLNCLQIIDVAAILDFCPNLTTFLFNGDWRLPTTDEHPMESKLTNSPHPNITTIGVHQFLYAFGVGYAAKSDRFKVEYMQRSNDMNFAALNRRNFPKLQCVRILSRALLRALESNNGPSQLGLSRWERWWDQCAQQKVRLEDCTGGLLGTLPQDEPQSDEDDEDDEECESDELETGGDWQEENRPPTIQELRDLLEECRRMSAEADQTDPVDLELLTALQM